jgi:hypothetical protein
MFNLEYLLNIHGHEALKVISQLYNWMKMKKSLELLLIILIASVLVQQVQGGVSFTKADINPPPMTQWNKTYGGTNDDCVNWMVQTSDGGYALAGETTSYGAGDSDFWLVKTDASGDLLWSKTYGGAGDDYASCVVQTSDGGYALAGKTPSFSDEAWITKGWLVKTDADGNMLWNQTYDRTGYESGAGAFSVVQTSDGGYALAGTVIFDDPFQPNIMHDGWLVKTDASGNMMWNQTYSRPDSSDSIRCVIQSRDGGYVLAGGTGFFGAPSQFWLVKTDASGILLWNQTGSLGWLHCVVETGDGGYVVAGRTSGDGNVVLDAWLAKIDEDGNMLWNQVYGGAEEDFASYVLKTRDGGYILSGYTRSFGAGESDAWLVKTDMDGNMLWNQTFGGANSDSANCVVETSDGCYVLAGTTRSYTTGDADGWLIKMEPELSPPVTKVYGIDVDGHTFTLTTVSNSTISNIDTSDVTTMKNMSFTVESSRGTGMCNITIPDSMLGGPYVLTIDGRPPWSSSTTAINGTHTALCFTYNGTGKYTAQIIGTTAVPEFTVPAAILTFGILTLTIVSLKRRRIFH